jgi:hypothetical protein
MHRDSDEDPIVSWRKSEKGRTLTVVKAAEERGILIHAIKRIVQITAAIFGLMGTIKLAGLDAYWTAFLMWMAHK